MRYAKTVLLRGGVELLVRNAVASDARALREVASRAGIRLLSGVHVDALDDLIVAWRGQGPIPLPGGRATRVGRGTQARILFEARSPEPTRDGG